MDLEMFGNERTGALVPIAGSDPRSGPWTHLAFMPNALADAAPDLTTGTWMHVVHANKTLAALDSTARHLPNPSLLRVPTLRREAQSTSALEGTYEPLRAVLTADADTPGSATMREVLNYVTVADRAFEWVGQGRAVSVPFLCELQALLVRGTPSESAESGGIRQRQVVIGRRSTAPVGEIPVRAARFVPPPPGAPLEASVRDLLSWAAVDRAGRMDPVVGAALMHYQFETLHPLHDGNGRLGRLLVVLHLLTTATLSEPTLTVSPWFEARRGEYYERLLAVSQSGAWDAWVGFFAQGVAESAADTQQQMLRLVQVQTELKDWVRSSALRADTAHALVDFAVANPSFTVRDVESGIGLSYGRANSLTRQLVELGILEATTEQYRRRFFAPAVLDVLAGD